VVVIRPGRVCVSALLCLLQKKSLLFCRHIFYETSVCCSWAFAFVSWITFAFSTSFLQSSVCSSEVWVNQLSVCCVSICSCSPVTFKVYNIPDAVYGCCFMLLLCITREIASVKCLCIAVVFDKFHSYMHFVIRAAFVDKLSTFVLRYVVMTTALVRCHGARRPPRCSCQEIAATNFTSQQFSFALLRAFGGRFFLFWVNLFAFRCVLIKLVA